MTRMIPSRRHPGSPRALRPLVAALALGLAGAVALAQASAPAETPVGAAAPPVPSALDAMLFYQLLLGELNVRGGDVGAGYSLLLDAARRTQDPQLFRRAVDVALQGRAGDAALAAARAWSDVLPQSLDAYRMQLQILLALNRPTETQGPLERVLALSPANAREDLINAIPQTYARVADKALAQRLVREALQRELAGGPHAAAAWTTVGRMELARDAKEAALEAARRGQAADGTSRLPVLLALQLLEQGVDGAEALVTRHLDAATSPDAAAMRLAYARTLLDLQRTSDASRQLERLTRAADGPVEAWLVLGGLQVQNNQPREAQATLETYLQRTASQPSEATQRARTQAYLLLAQAAEKQQDYASASRWLDRVENPGEMLAVQLRRASLLARQGKLDEARALIRAQPERLPSDGRAKLMAEAQLLRELGRYQMAYEVYTQAAARFPDDADVAYEQAMMAEKAGRADEMERILRQLIARQPDYHHAYNALGYSLADRNVRLPEAKQLIQKALEFAPGDPYIQDSLGWVEFRLGNTPEALRILQQAYGKRPDAEIAAHLGEVLWVAGQRDRARSIWREGLLLNPDNETLKETLRRFQVAQP